MRHVGVERLRLVLLQQVLGLPVGRKLARVPDHELVVVDADLDGRPRRVVLVDHGVEHRLAERVPRDGERLDPPYALVPDSRPQVFGGQQIDRLGDLREEVAVNLVVVEQIDVVAEKADLHVRTREENLRIGMEQQQGGPLQVRPLPQVQPADEGRRRLGQQRVIQTPAPPGLLPKPVHRRLRQVLQARVGHRNAVPVQSLLAQEKPGQRGALQLLPRAAAAVVVLALVADRVRLRLHDDLQVLPAGFGPQIDVHDNAQDVTHLVRNVLQQLADPGKTDDSAVVVPADDQHAALRVREAADPAQILVAPATLPLDVLALAHARGRLFHPPDMLIHRPAPAPKSPARPCRSPSVGTSAVGCGAWPAPCTRSSDRPRAG